MSFVNAKLAFIVSMVEGTTTFMYAISQLVLRAIIKIGRVFFEEHSF